MRNDKEAAPKIKKITRVRPLVPFDLLDERIPSWNYSISGQTGSGKSVLMNAILTIQNQEKEDNEENKE